MTTRRPALFAAVAASNLDATNGVVHIIDRVLMPPRR